MNKEEVEKQFLIKYGCYTLFDFVDVYLDFETALKIMEDYFEKQSQLDIANKKLEKLERGANNEYKSEFSTKDI